VQLLATSTVSILLLQVVAARTAPGADVESAWLRAGLVGTWTVATVAAGLIGFQRFQGTLVHLMMTPSRPARVVMPLVGSAATFGVLAFPLAGVSSWALGKSPHVASWPALSVGVALYWVACLSLACTVSALFVLTPNAMTYEALLAIPLVLVSGVFGVPEALPKGLEAVTFVFPTTPAVRLILQPDVAFLPYSLAAVSASVLWFAVAALLASRAVSRATRSGSLEVV
jgi:ABC-2 type transport system permease protein